MVNYVLMNSAAAESTNTLLITFQDVVELMNQVNNLNFLLVYFVLC